MNRERQIWRTDWRASWYGIFLAVPPFILAAQQVDPPTPPLQNGPPAPSAAVNSSGAKTGFEGARTSTTNGETLVPQRRPQIAVSAREPFVRAAFTSEAEAIRTGFLMEFGIPRDEWLFPIEVVIEGAPADVLAGPDLRREITLRPDQVFVLNLKATLHEGFTGANFKRELIRLLIHHEMLRPYYRDPDSFKGTRIFVPDWLVFGIYEHLEHKHSGNPSELFAGILKSGNIMSPRKILEQTGAGRLDPMSLELFKASSSALVRSLLEQPEGPESFLNLIRNLTEHQQNPAPDRDPDAILKTYFPELRGSREAVGKWWALQIAAMAEKTAFEFYTVEETQQAIDESLLVRFGGPPPEEKKRGILMKWLNAAGKQENSGATAIPLTRFGQFLDRPDAGDALRETEANLRNLESRGFPIYRPLIGRYERVVQTLIAGKTAGISDELKELERLRFQIDKTMERVADYMNYYEATAAPAKTESFEEYRQMREQLEKARPPARKDRITRQLDALEKEFE
ncbi:MAG: hypothetical protein HKN23_00780 [Verrucomicrobiales bacterium]|nr:hypothetical protein [Verrucomicrobiales bacterium]